MTTEGTDLERLRALAEKATPCAREVIDGNDGDGPPFRPLWQVQTPGVDDVGFPDDAPAIDLTLHVGCKGDADFIAACDPSTIIALITRCLAAEKERDEARAANIAAVGLANKYQALNSVPDAVAVIERVCVERDAEKARAEKAESALAQAIAERDRMAEALKPFAELGRELGDGVTESILWRDSDVIEGAKAYNQGKDYVITVGDLRRASQALTTTTEA